MFKTLPTELSMLKVVGFPPEIAHDKTADCPFKIGDCDTLKESITGGILAVIANPPTTGVEAGAAELTVIVIGFVIVPPSFTAAKT